MAVPVSVSRRVADLYNMHADAVIRATLTLPSILHNHVPPLPPLPSVGCADDASSILRGCTACTACGDAVDVNAAKYNAFVLAAYTPAFKFVDGAFTVDVADVLRICHPDITYYICSSKSKTTASAAVYCAACLSAYVRKHQLGLSPPPSSYPVVACPCGCAAVLPVHLVGHIVADVTGTVGGGGSRRGGGTAAASVTAIQRSSNSPTPSSSARPSPCPLCAFATDVATDVANLTEKNGGVATCPACLHRFCAACRAIIPFHRAHADALARKMDKLETAAVAHGAAAPVIDDYPHTCPSTAAVECPETLFRPWCPHDHLLENRCAARFRKSFRKSSVPIPLSSDNL